MTLKAVWQQYDIGQPFNYQDMVPYLQGQQQKVNYRSGQTIITRGDFPESIYFIISGLAIGRKLDREGNDYRYFQVGSDNGNLGLLEVLSRQEAYVATITCLTAVQVIKVDAALVYQLVMDHLVLLRKCSFLLATDLYQRSSNDGRYYFYSGTKRLQLFLIQYFEIHHPKTSSQQLIVKFNYEEIAAQIGVSVRTIGRSISKLKQRHELSMQGKRITLSDRQYQQMKKELLQ